MTSKEARSIAHEVPAAQARETVFTVKHRRRPKCGVSSGGVSAPQTILDQTELDTSEQRRCQCASSSVGIDGGNVE